MPENHGRVPLKVPTHRFHLKENTHFTVRACVAKFSPGSAKLLCFVETRGSPGSAKLPKTLGKSLGLSQKGAIALHECLASMSAVRWRQRFRDPTLQNVPALIQRLRAPERTSSNSSREYTTLRPRELVFGGLPTLAYK